MVTQFFCALSSALKLSFPNVFYTPALSCEIKNLIKRY